MSAYARLVDDQLPGRIRGLYLHGSLALGDYRPGRSDVDFVAVSDTALQPSEVDAAFQTQSAVQAPG
jgi:predicted nucleotidyltransferase